MTAPVDTAGPTGDDGLPRFLAAAWGRDVPDRRGPKPGLTIDMIAAAGVAAADADGLGAVSMARVAADLGFTTMSLYRYVDAKADLLALMFDAASGAPDGPTSSRTAWRKGLEAWARALRERLDRHRWILQLPITGPPLTPNLVRWMEAGLRTFSRTKLTHQERLSALLVVDGYVRNHLQLVGSIERAAQWDDPSAAGRTYVTRLLSVTDEASFPAVRAALVSGAMEDDSDFSVDEFEFGLRTVLDGVEAMVRRRAAGR